MVCINIYDFCVTDRIAAVVYIQHVQFVKKQKVCESLGNHLLRVIDDLLFFLTSVCFEFSEKLPEYRINGLSARMSSLALQFTAVARPIPLELLLVLHAQRAHVSPKILVQYQCVQRKDLVRKHYTRTHARARARSMIHAASTVFLPVSSASSSQR